MTLAFNKKIKTEDFIYITALVFILIMLITILLDFFSIQGFRHDELKYISTYMNKVKEEGRWLNYIFFDSLKLINIKILAFLNVVCFCIFSYTCLNNILDKKYAVIGSLAFLFIPSIHLLNEWAQTVFINFLLLAISSFVYKRINPVIFFSVFGILFNGVLSHFYFVLPLLFIHQKSNIIKILLYWILGFIVGFIFAECMTFLISDQLIRLAAWRNPNYIESIDDFINNIKLARKNMSGIYRSFGSILTWLIIPSIILFIYSNRSNKAYGLETLVAITMCACSVFAQAIPAGLYVIQRSSLCLFLSVCIIYCLSIKKYKYILLLFFTVVSLNFFPQNYHNINYLKTIMNIWITELESIPVNPQTLSGIVMLSSEENFKHHEKKLVYVNKLKRISSPTLAQPQRWAVAAYEVGYRRIYHNQWSRKDIDKIIDQKSLSELNFMKTNIYYYTIYNNYLILKLI